MKKITLLKEPQLGGLFLLFAALLAWHVKTRETPSSRTPALADEAVASMEAAPSLVGGDRLKSGGYAWTEGDRVTYRLHSEVRIESSQAGWEIESDAEQGVSVDGLLHLFVVKANEQSATVAFQATELVVLAEGRRNPEWEAELAATPQLVEMDRSGRVLSRAFSRSLEPETRERLAGLVPLQWLLGSGSAWTTKETEASGRFVCRYSRDPETGVMTKSRRPEVDGTQNMKIEVVRSHFEAVQGDVWLERLTGEEGLAPSFEGQRVALMRSHFRLDRIANDDTLPAALSGLTEPGALQQWAVMERRPENWGTSRSESAERRRKVRLQEAYAEVPFQVVFGGLVEAVENAERHADTLAAIEALQHWIEVHPDQAFRVSEELADPEVDPEIGARLAHALELAGRSTPEAQEALGNLILGRDAYPSDSVVQAIVASGDVGELQGTAIYEGLRDVLAESRAPDAERDALWSDAALFAVGRLAESNSGAREVLINALQPRLEAPGEYSAEGLVTALRSLGNGGINDADIVAASRDLMQHEDAQVRATAVEFLHAADSQDLSPAMAALEDPMDLVQVSGVEALADSSMENPEALNVLRVQLKRSDLSDSVRSAMTNALARVHSLQSSGTDSEEVDPS